VEARFFRRQAGDGREGRHDRVVGDGRRQRLDSHSAACDLQADVWQLRRRAALHVADFFVEGRCECGTPGKLGLKKTAVAVKNCRGLTKRDMINNDALPRMEVDPDTYEVRADGVLLTCEPAQVLPMAQRYFLF
jgi:hypothetical protein